MTKNAAYRTAAVCLTGWALLAAASGCTPKDNPNPIMDDLGRIAIYHGVNVANHAKSAEDHLPWHTREDFARLKEWGFNLVRYLIFWEAIEPSSGEYNDKYINATITRIQWMQELGIDVLLDLHQDLYHRKFGGDGFPDWTVNDDGIPFTPRQPWNLNYLEPAVMTCYDNFWRSAVMKESYVEMIQHLLSKVDKLPNVIGLEIMNEPWPYIGPGFEPACLRPFYEAIENMKIERGYRLPLYFEPVIFTSGGIPSRLNFKPQTPAVYSVHYYDPWCHENKPYSDFGRWLMKNTLNLRIREALRADTPLIYTEFGISPETQGYRDFLNDLIGLLDARQVSWTYYSYDKSSTESFGIVDLNGNTRLNIEPLIQIYPQRIAGRRPVWTRAPNRFELSFEPIGASGPTILFIPRSIQLTRAAVDGQDIPVDHASLYFECPAKPGTSRQTILLEWK